MNKNQQQIADDNDTSRQLIHDDDIAQIKRLSKKLEIHAKQNRDRDKLLDERDTKTEKKIDKLLPLVELIPTLNEIVENQKAMTIAGKKILRIIGYISATLGLLYLIFRFYKEIK